MDELGGPYSLSTHDDGEENPPPTILIEIWSSSG